MKENQIKVEPFDILNLLTYHGIKRENEHGRVELSGIINSEKTEEYINLLHQDTWVKISISDEKESRMIFQGIITGANITREGANSILSLQLKTGTYLLDCSKHIRSFQNPSLTFKDIINTVIGNYQQGNMIMTASNQNSGFMLQYRETDWSFLKRLASCMNTVLIADSITGGSKFFCGLPERACAGQIDTGFYQIQKQLDEYILKKMNGLPNIVEEDSCYYILKIRDIYDLGDEVMLNGTSMSICGMISDLEGSELCHTYYLKRRTGFSVIKAYNESIAGISMTGQVTDVGGTKIKLKLYEDENQSGCGERWFDFSTPYSSLGGAGFYCMPEMGDKVHLCFPSQEESTAYGMSAVHMEDRKNPSMKSIMNKEGKQIILAPDFIKMTNNAGMSLELNDRSGVKIESSGSITIRASGNLDLVSKTAGLTLTAKNQVVLKQGETTLNLAGDMSLKGAKVNLN